jgi:hypothetical protein
MLCGSVADGSKTGTVLVPFAQPFLHWKSSITHSQCVFVALVIQHVIRMRRITLSSVGWTAVQHFSTLSHKWHDFRGAGGGVTEHQKCVLIFLDFCLKHFSLLRKTERARIKNA